MGSDRSLDLIYAVLLLVLVGSALLAQGLPLRRLARMVLAWVGVFALLFLLLSFRSEVRLVWSRLQVELGLRSVDTDGARSVLLRSGPDGHFWVNASANGHSIRFLIDSGASQSGIGASTAEAIGVQIDEAALPVAVTTANGVVMARRGRIERLTLGPIEARNHPVLVAAEFGDTNVLGMNFLRGLESWRVEGDRLELIASVPP